MFFKIGVVKNSAIFTGKKLRWSLLNKVAGLQVFSCENCKIVQSKLFYRTPPVAASADVLLHHGVLIALAYYIFKETLVNIL